MTTGLFGFLSSILRWLFSRRREQKIEHRETTKSLATQLDKLANLLSQVLKVTSADGSLQSDKIAELELLRERAWSRWISILVSDGYSRQDPATRADIEQCVNIARAAPGPYVEEIYLVQLSLSEGRVSGKVRERFARSIDRIRDASARMRLNAYCWPFTLQSGFCAFELTGRTRQRLEAGRRIEIKALFRRAGCGNIAGIACQACRREAGYA